ncbi:MAG: cation diffusion facilitator family transporter, partial [Chloroflexi bacterium]|nr:cation diffusion facilitator family transporter [Chloroflexota bacterium]
MHEHDHVETGRVTARLRVALLITAGILIAEVVGGLLSNSLALLSDAGHVFTDVTALGLAWYANFQAEKPATFTHTYGFHRAGILAALANALSLVLIAGVIAYEAYQRLLNPEPVQSYLMFSVALVGLVANLYIARYLHREEEENLNVRSAWLHVIGDAAASAAVLLGGILILFTGVFLIDPILSVLISVVIIVGGWSIIVDALNILMEGVPRGLNLEELVHQIRAHPGVVDVHDVHVWSLAAGVNAVSCHSLVADQSLRESDRILH